MTLPEIPINTGTIIIGVVCAAILYVILMGRHLIKKDK